MYNNLWVLNSMFIGKLIFSKHNKFIGINKLVFHNLLLCVGVTCCLVHVAHFKIPQQAINLLRHAMITKIRIF